ncbi:MAG: hypothetical protein CBC35_07815 [Planctomycetes bacterium TMED75]|nr:mechanosensitive ion channel protein MscS [Planctomycetaceae bacterium]OUU92106.1 MAG: hypothetical protein CBC35_07815 [Planctomycetes bacterium TMED75]
MITGLFTLLINQASSSDQSTPSATPATGASSSEAAGQKGSSGLGSIDDLTEQGGVLWEILVNFSTEYGPKLLFAAAWLVVGWFLIKIIKWFASRALRFKSIDDSVRGFLMSLIDIALKVLLVVMLLGAVGVPTASLGFIVGAVSLAIGFALKGTLANFAGGVLILILKPYKVGDFIEAQGFSGTVRRIEMFWTILTTSDNKRIIIPNGSLSTGSLINYSSESRRRLDVVFGIGYGDDIDHACSVLQSIVDADQRTLSDPKPLIKVVDLGASSVDINVRLWVESGDFWGYRVDLLESVKKAFDAEGISFPFPQSEVTLHQATSS